MLMILKWIIALFEIKVFLMKTIQKKKQENTPQQSVKVWNQAREVQEPSIKVSQE